MSSITWIAEELLSNLKSEAGNCWRVVEAQHINSTMKLVDTIDEQRRLEELLDKSKPSFPKEWSHLHYLLFTPFRYKPHIRGSRFRKPGQIEGVFYASKNVETALAEKAFYSILFYQESPDTPLPDNPVQHTAFNVEYRTDVALDLTRPPLSVDEKVWMNPKEYNGCQTLADEARKANAELIKSFSVRCKDKGENIAILSPRAFKNKDPGQTQTWHVSVAKTRDKAIAISEFPRKTVLEF